MSQLVDIVLSAGQLEGTSASLATWLVKVGDAVKQGDPIAELETDKVVMEVCAETAGVIESLIANKGDKVAVEQVLGKIAAGELASSPAKASNNQAQPLVSSTVTASAEHSTNQQTARDSISPVVRRLLGENQLEIEHINGSGKSGRVTREDVLEHLKNPQAATQVAIPKSPVTPFAGSTPFVSATPIVSRALAGKMIPHTQMRKSIASHMVKSLLHTAPHVTSVFEMDMSNIIEHRKWHKKEYLELGVKLTFTAYFLAAMVQAVRAVPQVNARFHEDALEVFDDVNIGVGTALGDAGLVVPVVEQVQSMNLFEIAQNLNRQTDKARDGKLKPSDMRNGTITISNHGVSGSLIAAPIIINQPEVAILGIGKLEKRVVVESINGVDTMVVRPKCYVSLSIDHRALDAHQTNLFLNEFVNVIEHWGE